MGPIYIPLFLVLLSPITAEHIENYYLEYLANHYTEYENQSIAHNVVSSPTSRLAMPAIDYNYYYLYTRDNPDSPDILYLNDISSINSSFFDPALPVTVVVVHGWGGDVASEINPAVRDAFLKKSSVNVILVDWNHVSKENYLNAVRGVPNVGKNLGQFLAYLNRSTGALFSQMHLIGFSLGGHVVASAGKELNGKIARITGLDPAGPLWTLNPNRLKSTDAVYVEVIHTNRGVLGTSLNVGDVDIYPNGGAMQPGCTSASCNHNRSWQLFVASLAYEHLKGRRCDNILQAYFANCKGESFGLGSDVLQKFGTGMYGLKTSSEYPY